MSLFRSETDEELVERLMRETQETLNKLFDKMEGHTTFPGESNIIREDNIYAKNYEQINSDSGRINIGYKADMGFSVTYGVRVRIDVYHIGSILCAGIKGVREIDPIRRSNIKVSFFSKEKKIKFPVNNHPSLEIACKKLIIEKFDRFALHEEKLIPLNEKLAILGNQFKSQQTKKDLF